MDLDGRASIEHRFALSDAMSATLWNAQLSRSRGQPLYFEHQGVAERQKIQAE